MAYHNDKPSERESHIRNDKVVNIHIVRKYMNFNSVCICHYRIQWLVVVLLYFINVTEGQVLCGVGYTFIAFPFQCVKCATGKYQNQNADTACVLCEAGKYSAITGASTCINCDAGKYVTTTGSKTESACILCEAGKYSITGSSVCIGCEAGKYPTALQQHEQAVLPLIESARTNCRELVAELFREYAWPVLGACVATQLTILLLFACIYKCAHVALAHCCRPRASVQAPRDEESSCGIETRDL